MVALEVSSHARPDRESTIRPAFQNFGTYLFLISFASVYYLLNTPLMLGHYDLGWHLAAGDLIRERGNIPFQDPWSFTLENRQWYNLSWLWDVVASMVFQHAGLAGLVLLTIACGAVIAGYLASICLRVGASAFAVCIAVLIASVLYPSFGNAPNVYLAASPNTPTMLFCVVFFGECLKRTRWFLLPVMMALWVNLHGGFVLGFFIIGIFGALALLRRDWAGLKIYGLAAAGCFIAIFINPLGWHIYDGVTATLGHFVQANITEWQSYYLNFVVPGSIPGLLYILVFVGLELGSRTKGPVPLEARLLCWLFLVMGIHQFRYMAFFFIFSAIPLALHVDRWLSNRPELFQVQKSLMAAGIVGACALPVTFMQIAPGMVLPEMLSAQDARYLQANFSHARLLNNWTVGGLLIFRTHGTVPVFVDGRGATAYPDVLLRDYFRLVEWEIDESAWDALLAKYRIDTVLWVKAHEPLRRFLVDKRGWKEQYAGTYESVYVKP